MVRMRLETALADGTPASTGAVLNPRDAIQIASALLQASAYAMEDEK